MRSSHCVLAGVFLLVSPSVGSAQTQPPGTPAQAKTCGTDALGLSTDSLNRKCVAAAGRLAASRKDGLVLRMDDGTRKVFKDPPDLAEDAYGYMLFDFRPEQHVFFVAFSVDDGAFSTVVFGKTGLAIDCKTASPHLSPAGGALLLEDERDSSEPSSFSMIDTTAGTSARTVWRSKEDPTTISTHGLAFVGWDSDTTARLRLGNGPDGFVLLTRAADGHWHYDLAGAPPPEKSDTEFQPAAAAQPAKPPTANAPTGPGAPMELHPRSHE